MKQQLIIKLSPESTATYLKIAEEKRTAEMTNDMEASGMNLNLDIDLIPGLSFCTLKVDGKTISEDEDIDVELVDV